MRAKIAEIKVLLATDKKQATILAGLLVFLVISMGRMLLNMSPSKAQARDRTASKSVDRDKSHGSGNGALRMSIELPALPDGTRDIFALNPEKFPEPAQPDQSAEVPPKSDASMDESVEARALSEQQLAERGVRQEAERLRLKSTILGSNPIAVIEAPQKGKTRSVVLGVGDELDGFKLIEIQRFSVLIEKNGVRVELTRSLPDT